MPPKSEELFGSPLSPPVTGSSGTVTAGASAQLIGVNNSRVALQIVTDPAAATTVYLLLGSAGTASASNFHFALAPGGSWDGLIGGYLWRGAVQCYASSSVAVGVVEA